MRAVIAGRPHSVAVAIVGAGPQGLTAACYLRHAGVDAREIAVVDPSGAWLTTWRRQFAQLRIHHLRSPAVHHPHPDPYALIEFARATQRTDELLHTYSLPTTELFDDFCTFLIESMGLTASLRGTGVVGATPDGTLSLADGTQLHAEHVVWATNPARADAPLPDCGLRVHRWCDVDLARPPARVAVIGGGLTAAHLVEHACAAGSHVEWLTRRAVSLRDFDTDPGWLGPKEMAGFERLTEPSDRLRAVALARGGGTVPPWMMRRLTAAEKAGRLCRRVCDPGNAVSPGIGVEEVWLATGDQPDLSACPALHRLCGAADADVVGGRPVLDPLLRVRGTNSQVAGRLAQLQLGPTAGNLAGARRAAEAVVGAVVGTDAMYALADL